MLVANLRPPAPLRQHQQPDECGLLRGTNEIFMNTDSGRARRPLIVVENGRSQVTEEHVSKIKSGRLLFRSVSSGLVEYLDAEEEENTLIAIWEEDLTPTTPTWSWTRRLYWA